MEMYMYYAFAVLTAGFSAVNIYKYDSSDPYHADTSWFLAAAVFMALISVLMSCIAGGKAGK